MMQRLQPVHLASSVRAVCQGRIYPSWGLLDEFPEGTDIVLPVEVRRRPNGLPYVMVRLSHRESTQIDLAPEQEETLAELADGGATFVVMVERREKVEFDGYPPALVVNVILAL